MKTKTIFISKADTSNLFHISFKFRHIVVSLLLVMKNQKFAPLQMVLTMTRFIIVINSQNAVCLLDKSLSTWH